MVEERGIDNTLLASCRLPFSIAYFSPCLHRSLASRDVPLPCKEAKYCLFFFSILLRSLSTKITTLPVSIPSHNDVKLKDLQPSQLHHVHAAQQEIWQYNLGDVKNGI